MKKKKYDSYVFRRSSECACVRASVKCCFLFIFFNCIYYLCKKEKKKLDGEVDAKFPTTFDLIRSPERRIASFLFGDRIQRERKYTFIFATLSASEMSAFPGEDRREKWDILRPWNGLISAAARSEFSFFFV